MRTWIAAAAVAGSLAVGTWTLGVRGAETASGGSGQNSAVSNSDRPLARFIRGQIGRWMVLSSDLDLTDAQRDQLKSIVQSHKSEIAKALEPVVEKRRALRDAVLAANPDEKTIRADADDLGKSIGDAAVLAGKVKQEADGVLTDEQKQKLADHRAQSDHAVDEFLQRAANGQ